MWIEGVSSLAPLEGCLSDSALAKARAGTIRAPLDI
jgi:hypothetical protein